jgi:hypothetical protein
MRTTCDVASCVPVWSKGLTNGWDATKCQSGCVTTTCLHQTVARSRCRHWTGHDDCARAGPDAGRAVARPWVTGAAASPTRESVPACHPCESEAWNVIGFANASSLEEQIVPDRVNVIYGDADRSEYLNQAVNIQQVIHEYNGDFYERNCRTTSFKD